MKIPVENSNDNIPITSIIILDFFVFWLDTDLIPVPAKAYGITIQAPQKFSLNIFYLLLK